MFAFWRVKRTNSPRTLESAKIKKVCKIM